MSGDGIGVAEIVGSRDGKVRKVKFLDTLNYDFVEAVQWNVTFEMIQSRNAIKLAMFQIPDQSFQPLLRALEEPAASCPVAGAGEPDCCCLPAIQAAISKFCNGFAAPLVLAPVPKTPCFCVSSNSLRVSGSTVNHESVKRASSDGQIRT